MSEEIKDVVIEEQPQEKADGTSDAEVRNAKPELTEGEKVEAIVKKREAKLRDKLMAEFEAEKSKAEKLKAEEARLAELDDAGRLEAREKAFNLREAKLDAFEEMTSNGLSPTQEIVDMVADIDKSVRAGRIEKLKNWVTSETAKGVKSTLVNSPKQVIANTKPAQSDDNGWGAGTGNNKLRY